MRDLHIIQPDPEEAGTCRKSSFVLLLPFCLLALLVPTLCLAWGYKAHETINETACDLVPQEIRAFFQVNKDYIVLHSGDPDHWAEKRPDGTRLDPAEPPRHFIDLDELDSPPFFENIPYTYEEAARKLGRARLEHAGTLPYRIHDLEHRLQQAFEQKDWPRAVRLAAWLGHYAADAHMPLHTTKNYDGKETGNDGIHKRFEVEMVDRFPEFERLTASPGRPVQYVHNIPEFVFTFVLSSYRCVPQLFHADNIARQADPDFGDRYYHELRDASAGKLAMQRMTDAAHNIASLWYTAWVDAGKPPLPKEQLAQPPDEATLKE